MALVIANNVASLTAQHNLSRTTNSLSRSLERLSSGLKINRGADGPAALVISEQQRAQIAGLQSAIDNTSKAVSLVQTTEGALNEINSLLVKIRGLALDSANAGVHDANSLAANQAEVTNALATIDRIANNTQFGTKKVLDGSAGFSGTPSDSDITFLKATSDASAGTYAVNITTAAERAVVKVSTIQTAALAQDETLTINGVSVSLASGSTTTQVQGRINEFTAQTGVVAENHAINLTSNTALTTGGVAATGATVLTTLDPPAGGAALVAGDKINFSGTRSDGTTFSGTFTVAAGDTVTTLLTTLNGASGFNSVDAASINASGNLIVTGKAANATNDFQIALTLSNATTNTGNVAYGTFAGDAGETRLRSVQFGTGASISVQSNVAAATNSSGFGVNVLSDTGVNVAGTIGGFTAAGNGNVLTGASTDGAKGISIAATGLDPTSAASFKTVTGSQGTLTILDNSLNFQIGANSGQTAKVTVDNVKSSALGLNVIGNLFAKLSDIDVRTFAGAQDSIKVVDQAINEVTNLRGLLGAFQQQTLESTANNLRATLENTVSAESVIRDTDFAQETAAFTKNQVLLQAGTTVLSNANQVPQLIVSLLGQ